MNSNILIVFLITSATAQNPTPTQANICDNPIFDAALVVSSSDIKAYIKDKRYLFKDQFVLPYLRESNPPTIDWPNIKPITDIFKGLQNISALSSGLRMAFEVDEEVYVILKNEEDIYILDKTNNFNLKTILKNWEDFGHEFIKWTVDSVSDTGVKTNKTLIFVDALAKKYSQKYNLVTKALMWSDNQMQFEFEFPDEPGFVKKIDLLTTLFPLIFMYKETRIPTLFDVYYQTKTMETIFFREDTACVSLRWSPARWAESDYCRSFVDTRTIIGCIPSPSPPVSSGPEIDPNEPAIDIAPDV